MALVIKDKSKDPLKETGKSKTLDGIKSEPQASVKPNKIDPTKKKGFFRTTVQELRKVDWPGFKQTFNWSIIVILFTILISITLGFFDHVFNAGIDFVDCTSPQARGQDTTLEQCGRELADNLTFRN
jgi:preprotein translocase SecE subunit